MMKQNLSLMRSFPARAGKQVELENMQSGPYNRWAFPNMRRLLPTANVWRGNGPVYELPAAPLGLAHLEFAGKSGETLRIGDVACGEFTDGLVVLNRGAVVWERYDDGIEAHEPHLLMSVSKSIAGSLTGILVERGLLSPSDRITDIIAEVKNSAYEDATLRNLLDMTVGMEYDEDYDNPLSDIGLLDAASGWRPAREGMPDNLRDYICTMRKGPPHGESFHYVSTNTDLLGWILERASGLDFATLLSREIWQPMGAETDAYVTLDRLGAPQADGGICVTTRDLARFGQLHLQEGCIDGRRIIPARWIRDFQENGDAETWNRGNFAADLPGYHYRSKWYTDLTDPHRAYKGIGIHGQVLFVDPVTHTVIAHHASHPAPLDHDYFENLFLAFKAISRELV